MIGLNFITDKKYVKGLENETVPIENLEQRVLQKGFLKQVKSAQQQMRFLSFRLGIQGWYHYNNLKAYGITRHWKTLIELFGTKPLYYPIHECKNALWCFSWKGNPVLFYKDKRGVSIQVLPEFPVIEIEPLYIKLIEVLKSKQERI